MGRNLLAARRGTERGGGQGCWLPAQADILRQKYPSYWLPFLKAPYAFIYAVGPYFGVPRDLIKCACTRT